MTHSACFWLVGRFTFAICFKYVTMLIDRRKFIAAASLTPYANGAHAADPLKIVLGLPPGGPPEQLARALVEPLGEAMGQTVVLEHKPGSNGNVAASSVAQSAADGKTLLLSASSTITMNPHVYQRHSFDASKALVPVASALRLLVYLVVSPALPVRDINEFLLYFKNNPGKLRYGSGGVGTVQHVFAEMLSASTGATAVHVPYKSIAEPVRDLVEGKLDFIMDPGFALAQVMSKQVRLLAVGSRRRSTLFPDTPTIEDAGLRGFDADTWYGLFAPAGTSKSVLGRINKSVSEIVKASTFAARMKSIGATATAMSAEDFASRLQIDYVRHGALIRARGIFAG